MGKNNAKYVAPAGSLTQRFSLAELLRPAEEAPIHAYRDVVSGDGRRAQRVSVPVGAPPSPIKKNRREHLSESAASSNPSLTSPSANSEAEPATRICFDEDAYTMTLVLDTDIPNDVNVTPSTTGGAAQSTTPVAADPALREWAQRDRDEFLALFLWLDGRGSRPQAMGCARCLSVERPAVARCCECSHSRLVCVDCCVAEHAGNPLHWIEVWNGQYFKRTSLKSIGLRVQLGHPLGEHIRLAPSSSSSTPMAYTMSPSSFAGVISAATRITYNSSVVDGFQRRASSRAPDIAPYNYYKSLEYLTDGASINKPPDRYRLLLRMLREYRHILLLKRRGRGHDPMGVNGTRSGELAIRCPSCPRPGVNLPDNWDRAPPEDECLYIQFVGVDACFRLKRRLVSSWAKDPGLRTGWSYFVEWEPYRQHLLSITDQKEMTTCSGLAALDHADTKFSRGYSVTGVGMCVCTRHEFVLPNGVGDLQKGEWYGNMDYIFASALRYISRLLRVTASYDIACQWSRRLQERLARLPSLVRLKIVMTLFRFVVPKMHIKGHVLLCQLLFSLSFAAGSGQTDGEGIERMWVLINGIVTSTRSCGPGSRADQLDDHWSYLNWMKLVGLPVLLRRRLDAARTELGKQEEAFGEFTVRQLEHAPEWQRSVEAYERPVPESAPQPENLYELQVKGLSEKEVRAMFANQEAEDEKNGAPKLHSVSPSAFVAFGLDLEEQQRKIGVQAELHNAGSSSSKSNLATMRKQCIKDQASWRLLLATYSPASIVRLDKLDLAQDVLVENIPLMMPSGLSSAERETGCCDGVVQLEIALREAQCREALIYLRVHLHVKARLMLYKVANARHQGANTRSRTLINRNEGKIKIHAEKYQCARHALVALLGTVPATFPPLRRADIRCMDDGGFAADSDSAKRLEKEMCRLKRQAQLDAQGEPSLIGAAAVGDIEDDDDDLEELGKEAETVEPGKEDKVGESKRVMSWIWNTAGLGGTEKELTDALRVKWCKAFARVRRWREEVRMLEEGTRRYPVSLEHEADRWVKRLALTRDVITPKDAPHDWTMAYAAKQRDLYRALVRRAAFIRTEVKPKRGSKRKIASGDSELRGDRDIDEEPLQEGDAEDEG
uniref:CxC2-like cysteine cluster KDZ transposase-associated domain-containing protein n=1 Tax=Mycena chlorophos TaxID=658473 RepID=A0ABQ0L0W9_MYCCL|nr:predicted protein [Mycena chlorophos]